MAALIRRALIKVLIGGGTAAGLGVGAKNCRLFGRDKIAKQDVDYQDSPKGLLMSPPSPSRRTFLSTGRTVSLTPLAPCSSL